MQEQGKENPVVLQLVYHMLVWILEILLVFLVIVGIISCCQRSYRFCYEVFGSVPAAEEPGQNKDFQVNEEDTMFRVAARLKEENLIVGRYSFYVRATLMDQSQLQLRPGNYVLNTSMDYEEIINELTMSE